MAYAGTMAKDVTLNVRMEKAELEALRRAAMEDQRSPSSMLRLWMMAQLRAKGFLPAVSNELTRRESADPLARESTTREGVGDGSGSASAP